MHALLIFASVLSWCSTKDWSEHPDRCLTRAGLQERYKLFDSMVRDIAESQHLSKPSVRPGNMYDDEGRVEVWHIGEGQYEIRIRPDVLRDVSDDSLLYFSAHEICHITNGDAGYGTWNTWTEQERQVRHRWVRACAFAIVGKAVFASYLAEAESHFTNEQQKELIRRIEHDATYWLEWRRKKQRAVP